MLNIDFFSDRNIKYNECNKVSFNKDKFKKYKLFYNLIIKDKLISKPNGSTSYATQGVCSVDDIILVTSYDTKCSINDFNSELENSILDIIDNNGRYKTLYFDNKYHVGGISYCKNNNKLYVSGNRSVNIYDINYIASLCDNSIIKEYDSYKLDINKDSISNASYLTTYYSNLYVGEFKKFGISYLTKYKLNDSSMVLEKSYKVPYSKIQGMCVCNYNNETYYLFSSSYGRRFNSKLYITKLVNDKFVEVFKITLPCMLEQISFDNDLNLIIVFESDCYKYCGFDGNGKALNSIDSVCFLDIKSILDNI